MEPSSSDLPFVLVYGPWIWKIGLGVLVAVVLALAFALRRYRAWRHVRGELVRMERRDTDQVIRGTLGGGDAATVSVSAPYADAQRAHWRADALWVDTPDGRVHLDGDLVVELGTESQAKRYGLPEMPDALRKAVEELPLVERARWSVMQLARVQAGDAVIVRGKLVQAPGQQEATFREAPLVMTLKPTFDPMVLVAQRPRHALPMMAPFRMVLLAGLTLFGGYKAASSLGDDWRKACWDADEYRNVTGFVEVNNNDRCARAAALPGNAERTYSGLFHALADHPYRDERSLARLAYLAEKGDDCRGFLYVLDKAGRLDDLAAYARRCNDPHWEQEALFAAGRYDEAVAVKGANQTPSLEILIAAERWADAARSVEETAQYFEAQQHEDPNVAAVYTVAARQKRCLAQLFRHDAGDPAAAGKLQALASNDPELVCLPMLLEVDPLQRKQKLTTMDIWGVRYDVGRVLEAQAFLDGIDRYALPFWRESPEATLVQLDDNVRSQAIKGVWLMRLGDAASVASPEERATVLRWHAVAKVLDGKLDEAAQLALEVAPLTKERDALLLPSAIALYTPSQEDKLDPWLARMPWTREPFGRLFLRAGRDVSAFRFGHDAAFEDAFEEARRGDGSPLAAMLAKESWWSLGDVLAVLPRVQQGRDLLRERLVWTSQYGTWRSRSPFDLASTAAMRRQLLRVAGDDVHAEYWDRIYQRVARVFDRKRMIAFLLAE